MSKLIEENPQMLEKVTNTDGFIAALDQSGGSTPKALKAYGYPSDGYVEGEESMFEAVHAMRCRIMTAPCFDGSRVLGAILFENTMHREVEGKPTAEYLWSKNVVPFLKIDKGLAAEENGVQLMKPIPGLDETLKTAHGKGIFGTKMRSVVHKMNAAGIEAIVKQQFEVGKQIFAAGLIPIIEPEVTISSPDKVAIEDALKACILKELDALDDTQKVMLKLSIPTKEDFYTECIDHPKCVRVVALSGGYERDEANALLKKQPRMIASFSRALAEGLSHGLAEEEYNSTLDKSIGSIFEASKSS